MSCVILFIDVYKLHSCIVFILMLFIFFFFKQKTAYEMRISDWSSDVCSSDLSQAARLCPRVQGRRPGYRPADRSTRSRRLHPGLRGTRLGRPLGSAGTPPTDRKSTRLNSSH